MQYFKAIARKNIYNLIHEDAVQHENDDSNVKSLADL